MIARISLPTKLDYVAHQKLYEDLKENIENEIEIDARGVKSLGGLPAQTLLAAHRDWSRRGVPFTLILSEAVKVDLRRLGVLEEVMGEESSDEDKNSCN